MAARPTKRNGRARVAFLDDDHVMKMARQILTAEGDRDERVLREFFAPEPVAVADLLELGDGLRVGDGAAISLIADDGEAALADADVLLFRRGRIDRKLLERCPNLILVQRLGEDPSCIDLEAASELGIEVSCLSRRTLRFAAEHVMTLMLAVVKALLAADRAVRKGVGVETATHGADGSAYNWAGIEPLNGLDGRTLGLVGCGEIGGLVARRAAAFGMRVLYTDVGRLDPAREGALGIEFCSLPDLLGEADVVSVHVPSVPATAGLIGAREIAAMRPGAWLINTSRGPVVAEDPLYEALVAGHLAGAALDVHDPEPRPPSDRFCRLDNVVLTPHISGGSRLGVLAEIGQMFDNVRAVLDGAPAPHGRVELSDAKAAA